VIKDAKKGKLPPTFLKSFEEIGSLILDMIRENSAERPTLHEVKNQLYQIKKTFYKEHKRLVEVDVKVEGETEFKR